MGLKDQEDGTGHILELGLEYLHVPGAERAAERAAERTAERAAERATERTTERTAEGTAGANAGATEDSEAQSSSVVSEELSDPEDDTGPSSSSSSSSSPDPPTDRRSKVDFALKLGYSEDQVLLVLRKLGPDALTNDILGELVKFGTRSESQDGAGSATAAALGPAPLSSPEPRRSPRPGLWTDDKDNLRPVVLDGSNVAMSHGNKEVFSCQGIQLAVDWFLERGHRDVTVFVPAWRKEQSRPDALISEQEILRRLEKQKILVFTPSRRVQGRRVVCYDDRFIVKLAFESDGVIVSNDNYRDLANEKPEWKSFIDRRLLMYSFVNDKFMPPDDPLGRHGPSLDNFLRKRPVVPEHRKQPCPYGKKCTYGHKCKFFHPERGSHPQRSVADELRASAKVSKSLTDDSLVEEESPEPWQSTPKKASGSGLRGSLSDLCEDRRKSQSRRGSGSSSSSGCSSFLGYNAPPSPGSLDRWDLTSSELLKGDSRCESPEAGYSSMVKAYSGLSLEFPQSPERFSTVADLKTESLFSDCSSESSLNIFSPDLSEDNGPKAPPLHRRLPSHTVYSRHGLPQTGLPQHGLPQHGLPQTGLPQHGLPQHGLPQHVPQTLSQDMPKHYSSDANVTFQESTSYQADGVRPQGRSQDSSTLGYNSFTDRTPAEPHGSLLSIAQHNFAFNGFEEIPSSLISVPNLLNPSSAPVSSRLSPQSSCRGLPKQRSQQTRCGLEESTSSAMTFANTMEFPRLSSQEFPPGLTRQVYPRFEDPPPSTSRHATSFTHFNRPELHKPRPQGYRRAFDTSHTFSNPESSQRAFVPSPYLSPKGFSGEYHNFPPPKTLPTPSPRPHQSFSGPQHPWETSGAQDCDIYSSATANDGRREQPQANWDFHAQPQSYEPYHLFTKNRDVRDEAWRSPWRSAWSDTASPKAPARRPDAPALSQYRDLREKLFLNLCGVFPPDLVRVVMARNPHTMDAQELAAAILLAKSQRLT